MGHAALPVEHADWSLNLCKGEKPKEAFWKMGPFSFGRDAQLLQVSLSAPHPSSSSSVSFFVLMGKEKLSTEAFATGLDEVMVVLGKRQCWVESPGEPGREGKGKRTR